MTNDNGLATAYPLSWPRGWKRTARSERQRGKFNKKVRSSLGSWNTSRELSIADAVDRVLFELRAFGVERESIIISTDLKLRKDGLPFSEQREPTDSGAAVYWSRYSNEGQRCMAIDQYSRIADNLAAIAATLEAMRAIERHGGAEILDRAFDGFAALPAAGASSFVGWWQILGVKEIATPDEIKTAYRALAKLNHPDTGGDAETFIVIQKAYEQAKQERGFA